jgi:hypothetical protein
MGIAHNTVMALIKLPGMLKVSKGSSSSSSTSTSSQSTVTALRRVPLVAEQEQTGELL